MKKYSLIILLLISAACAEHRPAGPPVLRESSPESAGFSTARLARLDSAMARWTRDGWMNGAVAFVARNGKIVYHKAAGYNNLKTKEPLQRDGIFRIASQTKAITSVAIMILYEEGKLLLEDPVAKFIPTFANAVVLDKFNAKDTTYTTVPAVRQITLRDLLTHTSGIGYAQIGSPEANAIYAKSHITAGLDVHGDTLVAAMTRLGKLPLMQQPGKSFLYGLNIDVLGAIVEIVSGLSLDEFFQQRIFAPLGMKDTYFNIPEEKASRLVNFFMPDSTGQLAVPKSALGGDPQFPLRKKTYFSGGGGLSSTITDYAIFLQMLLNGGQYNGVRILSRNAVRMMTMNQIGDLMLDQNKFGLGFGLVTEESSRMAPPQAGTYSWGGAFSTVYWVDPKEEMVVSFYRQMWGPHGADIDQTFKVLVYQALND